MESKPSIIVTKGLQRKVDLSKVQWDSDMSNIEKEAELTSEETEELKRQTRRSFDAEGREWRGRVVTLYNVNPYTGNLCPINLDFRDEAIEPKRRRRRPHRRRKRQQVRTLTQ